MTANPRSLAASSPALDEWSRQAKIAQDPFFRYFGEHLSGAQSSALKRLQHSLDLVESSGNACASYDGVPAPDTFEAKTVQDHVIEAQTRVRRCAQAVVADVQPSHVSAWWLLEHALKGRMTPQQAGDAYERTIGQTGLGQKKRRAVAIKIISRCAASVLVVIDAESSKRR